MAEADKGSVGISKDVVTAIAGISISEIAGIANLRRGDSAFRRGEGMKRYVDYLTGKAFFDLVSLGLGDWVPPFGLPSDYTAPLTLLASSYYYVDADTVSKIAAILGKNADARKYSRLAAKIRRAFNRYLYDR